MTTAGTLLSAGESFFTALLSGRHENVTDSSGALFIDSEGWGGIGGGGGGEVDGVV